MDSQRTRENPMPHGHLPQLLEEILRLCLPGGGGGGKSRSLWELRASVGLGFRGLRFSALKSRLAQTEGMAGT